ncbi:MAG: hypothetical protein NC409_13160 [Clostridium sp.]|nr:hypothetical protein [Clostridium sp.]
MRTRLCGILYGCRVTNVECDQLILERSVSDGILPFLMPIETGILL